MEKWFIHTKKSDFDGVGKKFNISPILARIIRNRDIVDESDINLYLNGTLDDLHSPWILKDMEKAVDIIIKKISDGSPIRVIGDYDIDGICASFILVDALKNIGANIDYDIPDRVEDGYGINNNLIDKAVAMGVDTIITCDNGIAAIDAVKYAKSLGMTVIITDHHDIPFKVENELKIYLEADADAIINPKQIDCKYPFKELCGAAISYKLIEGVYEKKNIEKENTIKYLEYAAIATIGDVVDLKNENRIIVKYGLDMLNSTKNIGLNALIRANKLEGNEIKAYHVGFILGPCLNASGRLSTAKFALSLLNEGDENNAKEKAHKLKELNDERKKITEEAVNTALSIIESSEINKNNVLLIYLPECHESIAGIVAGRVREKYHKPTFVLTKAEVGVKGSGRSIETYNMADELSKCRELLIKFGGHPMAAGLSLNEENIDILRDKLNKSSTLTQEDLVRKSWIDVAMPFNVINEDIINQLSILEPFGKANEKPVFAERSVKIKRINVFGKNKNVIRFDLENSQSNKIPGIAFDNENKYISYLIEKFGQDEVDNAFKGLKNNISVSIIYYPQINEYNGFSELRIMIKSII